jgi:hypothetical protein
MGMSVPDSDLSSTDPQPALVHQGTRHWVLEPGKSVSFGRGSPCDIRIAHDPLDEYVSRRAGTLDHLGEEVRVRNESSSRALIFSPARGRERLVRPGEAVTCGPDREFLVGLTGRDGTHYVIQVTAPRSG